VYGAHDSISFPDMIFLTPSLHVRLVQRAEPGFSPRCETPAG
jgi:hypothetical protein